MKNDQRNLLSPSEGHFQMKDIEGMNELQDENYEDKRQVEEADILQDATENQTKHKKEKRTYLTISLKVLLVSALLIVVSYVIIILTASPPFNADWANVRKYSADNALLSALPPGTNQVVFMGDSITENCNLGHYFPGKPYVNRGVAGQDTPEILVRFRPDVINLHPNVTVILGGTNDIADNATIPNIVGNLQSMHILATAADITVIIASILPVCSSKVIARPPAAILEINKRIKDYCQTTGAIYLDYFSALVGSDGLLREEYAMDCVHPNDEGYKVMAPLAQAAIDRALALKNN